VFLDLRRSCQRKAGQGCNGGDRKTNHLGSFGLRTAVDETIEVSAVTLYTSARRSIEL
jgi:hypothetical protein